MQQAEFSDDATAAAYSTQDVSGLLAALSFAAVKHQAQRRKGRTHTPYINHPIQVLSYLWKIGGVRDMTVLVAALLHDTLEDTETTPEEIAAQFGPEVLALVEEVTDDKSLPKAVRKRLQVEHASDHGPGAKMIKLADKMHNVYELTREPPVSWSLARLRAYVDWADQVVAGLRGVNVNLEVAYDEIARDARARLAAMEAAAGHDA